jgi:hypothetical protein
MSANPPTEPLEVDQEGLPWLEDPALRCALRWKSASLKRQFCWMDLDIAEARGEGDSFLEKKEGHKAGEEMKHAMAIMEVHSPTSVAGARAVLDVVVQILALRKINPSHGWFEGDILQLVVNARRSLDWIEGTTKLGTGEGK